MISDKLDERSMEFREMLKSGRSTWAKFLIFKLQVDNRMWSEAMLKCTVADYQAKTLSPAKPGKMVIISAAHKRNAPHEPGNFVVTEISERLIDIYLYKVRPSLITEPSQDLLFLNPPKEVRLQGSNIANNFRVMWAACNGNERMLSHFLPRAFAMETRENCPEDFVNFGCSMKPTQSIFDKKLSYFRVNESGGEMDKLQEKSLGKKMRFSNVECWQPCLSNPLQKKANRIWEEKNKDEQDQLPGFSGFSRFCFLIHIVLILYQKILQISTMNYSFAFFNRKSTRRIAIRMSMADGRALWPGMCSAGHSCLWRHHP